MNETALQEPAEHSISALTLVLLYTRMALSILGWAEQSVRLRDFIEASLRNHSGKIPSHPFDKDSLFIRNIAHFRHLLLQRVATRWRGGILQKGQNMQTWGAKLGKTNLFFRAGGRIQACAAIMLR